MHFRSPRPTRGSGAGDEARSLDLFVGGESEVGGVEEVLELDVVDFQGRRG